MAIIRCKSGEIQFKVVYYGPGQGGKTTNLVMIHKALGKKVRGDLISINTAGDRTIFFDFLPMDLGTLRDLSIKISVYTVPGQVMYNDTRKLVLKGVDGVVFVADSQKVRRKQNLESLANLEENLHGAGIDTSSIPVVLQYNKRDLDGKNSGVMAVEEMEAELNASSGRPSFAASALYGDGVKDTFKKICMMTVAKVCEQVLKP
ncbi:MAG: GTPase domain-containing protein [Bacteroidetes bacterium]|nr:GTPase domain-containing protein [Bacteroidota bacterium]